MSTDYNYDEQGQFFPYFILTISTLVTVPLTYSLLRPTKELENTAPRIQSDFKPEEVDLIEGQKKKQRRKERRIKRITTAIVGWAVIGFMCYLIAVTAKHIPKIWDPYDILGISRSASEKAIKSHYKKLSVKFHPDKIRPDPALNQTAESLSDHYVELTKAYKALTDEEVRNNYVQYGHPDGKQSFSIGIALPKFIITDGNGKYVLLVYGLLLGVLLPYVVGKWWYGTQRMTREKVLIASAGNLFQEFKDDITEGGVVTALSSGEEFKEVLKGEKGEAGLAKIEGRILAYSTPAQSAGGLMTKERLQLQDLDEGVRRKALGLLWAYIGRISLDSSELDDEKYEAAPIALALNEAFLAIALAFGLSKPILNSYHTSQNIIQAMPPTASPLLQLPHITRSIAAAIEGNNKSHVSIQQYMSLSEDKRRRLSIGTDKLTDSQYKSVVRVAKQMPVLHVEKAFFKVTGERFITPSSLVQFIVKARLIPPGTQKIPPVNSVDLEDVDPDEGDVNALLGRKKTRKTISADGTTKIELVAEEKPIQPTLAFAPYFARDHSPRWHVFLADSKQGKMAVPPFTFTTFDKPLYKDDGSPTFNVQTLKMQFQAPPQAGQYTFVMHMICDSYVGLDTKMEVVLPVQEMSRAEEMVGEDEISEPDEESLAGQMQALKTGGVAGVIAPPPKKKRTKSTRPGESSSDEEEDDDDDDESDTEGEEDASDTDTDTDTDDE